MTDTNPTEAVCGCLPPFDGVRLGSKQVIAEYITAARDKGATDLDIHDTVPIAAVFCMCNRYVDGLDLWARQDTDVSGQSAALRLHRRMGRNPLRSDVA